MVLDPNYEGDLEQGKKHGKGVYTWPDGRRYEGHWKDDLKEMEKVFPLGLMACNLKVNGKMIRDNQMVVLSITMGRGMKNI